MAKHEHDGRWYAPFGDGWVSRASPEDDWEPVDDADVPMEVHVAEAVVVQNHRFPRVPAGTTVRREPNEVLDGIAEELGLKPDELRLRLSDTSDTGTRIRVPEKRFNAIAKTLGMKPDELRDRFGGRHPALRDPSRPGAI